MLRLQQERNREISVSLRTREKLLSRTFIYALGIAVGIHLFAALVFQIHAYLNTDEGLVPPIMVQADLGNLFGEGDNRILANLEENENLHGYLLAPVPSSPRVPPLPAAPADSQIEYVKEASFNNNPFIMIEDDWDYLVSFKPAQVPSRSVTVNVSGELAESHLIENGLQQLASGVVSKKSSLPHRVSYDVQVEGKTGRIFWQMKNSPEERPAVLAAAEKILDGMRFQQNEEVFVTAGKVEIVFVGM